MTDELNEFITLYVEVKITLFADGGGGDGGGSGGGGTAAAAMAAVVMAAEPAMGLVTETVMREPLRMTPQTLILAIPMRSTL